MSDDPYRSILLIAHSEINGVLPAIAARLKSERGSRVILAVNTEQDKAAYEKAHPGLFDAVETMVFRYRSLLDPIGDEGRWFAEARALERRLRFPFVHLLMDDRHFGLGFSAGGTNYAETGWSVAATHAKGVRSYVLFVNFFERILREYDISLVLNPTKACTVVARALGIPTRIFTAACFKNYWTWTINEFMESNLIPAAFADPQTVASEALTGHYEIYMQVRREMFGRFRTPVMIRNALYELLRYPYYHLRRYEKRFGLRPLANARAHWRIWEDYRALRRQPLRALSELEKRPFIYFPLSVEPEVTLTRESPEFNHQAYAIHSIAAGLPADMVVAVKEHISGIGTRPRDFYRNLAKIPNVVLLDPSEWGMDVIRKARVVATINGTSGFEAAVLGVPVLTFSVHNRCNIVPHVRVVRGWPDMSSALDDVLGWADQDPAPRKLAGGRYLGALVSASVDCGSADFRRAPPPDLLASIVGLLDRTLTDSGGRVPIPLAAAAQ
jgi:hypothetical protein